MKNFCFAVGLLLISSFAVFAHGDDRHFPNRQDVTVRTQKITENVYLLQGRGGNIAALTGMEGILIVDDEYKVVSEKLREALKTLGSASPRFILNTHWHGDHTEGNQVFGKESIIVAHINVRKRLIQPPVIFGRPTAPYPSFALPIVTYTQTMSLHINREEIRLLHYPNGHTDGDTIVHFVNAKVYHLGDDFFRNRFPFVDIDSGGSVQGLINNIGQLIGEIPADAKVIPGHGPLSTLDDLKQYRQAIVETGNIVQAAMKENKSLDEIKKRGLPAKYAEWGSGFIKTDAWIETIYRSYSRK
ncbi:MAG: MBL fold metallo-hydrolase [Pyrinomonadaceae bacterium]